MNKTYIANENHPELGATQVDILGKDEMWCVWWGCQLCGNKNIIEGSNYCSMCGREIMKPTKGE